jgi:hypothetical protein
MGWACVGLHRSWICPVKARIPNGERRLNPTLRWGSRALGSMSADLTRHWVPVERPVGGPGRAPGAHPNVSSFARSPARCLSHPVWCLQSPPRVSFRHSLASWRLITRLARAVAPVVFAESAIPILSWVKMVAYHRYHKLGHGVNLYILSILIGLPHGWVTTSCPSSSCRSACA